jgi:hypothetical protein
MSTFKITVRGYYLMTYKAGGCVTTQSFKSTITKSGSKTIVMLPFDPNEIWGAKERHHTHGTINGRAIRGTLGVEGERYFIALGDAWRRDNGLEASTEVTVELSPEGPQTGTMAADITGALEDETEAKEFFEALPTFYRKNYVRWIENAKRPETRAARIGKMVELLKAGKREK